MKTSQNSFLLVIFAVFFLSFCFVPSAFAGGKPVVNNNNGDGSAGGRGGRGGRGNNDNDRNLQDDDEENKKGEEEGLLPVIPVDPRLDLNGDGVISAAEQAAYDAWIEDGNPDELYGLKDDNIQKTRANPSPKLPEDGQWGLEQRLNTSWDPENCNIGGRALAYACFVVPPDAQLCDVNVFGAEAFYFDQKDGPCTWEDNRGTTKEGDRDGTSVMFGNSKDAVKTIIPAGAACDKWNDDGSCAVYADGAVNVNNVVCACLRHAQLGCFPPGVWISMADGSKKLVENISKGDQVWNPVLKQAVKVKRIIESPEKLPLIEIGYDDTRTRVSQTHPVYTKEGFKKASSLSTGNLVLGADGEYHQLTVVRELPVEEGQYVINFELVSDVPSPLAGVLIADGVVTGDFVKQIEIAN